MKTIRLLLAGGLVLGAGACDILDTAPKQSLSPEQFISSLDAMNNVLASTYNRLQSTDIHGQRLTLVPDVLADNASITTLSPSGRLRNESQNLFGTNVGGWGTYYGLIGDANLIIDKADGVGTQSAADVSTRKRYKGEAYFLRAYAYHNLARIYGPEPGDEALRGTDRSVPIRVKPVLSEDAVTLLPRSSVDSVYAQIRSDLDSALTLLTASGTNDKFRANRVAVRALRARVELYAEKWGDAESFATAALADSAYLVSGGARLVRGNAIVAAYRTQPNPESIFEVRYNAQTESIGVNESIVSLVQPARSNTRPLADGRWGDLVPSTTLRALFTTGDERAGLISNLATSTTTTPVYTTKYGSYVAAQTYTDNVPVLRHAELYLIRAEARLEQTNPTGALSDINRLRVARGAAPLTSVTLTDIMNERRRELNFEGHRWFDLKRRTLDLTKSTGNLAASDFRWLAPIPSDQIQLNPRYRQNPGY